MPHSSMSTTAHATDGSIPPRIGQSGVSAAAAGSASVDSQQRGKASVGEMPGCGDGAKRQGREAAGEMEQRGRKLQDTGILKNTGYRGF